tara:strand:+ start:11627 stop:12337 length:711 start_codon:yes stop_codon:yes gene_type:complete
MAVQVVDSKQMLENDQNLIDAIGKIKFIRNDYRKMLVAVQSNRNCLLPSAPQAELKQLAELEIIPPNENEQWVAQSILSGKLSLLSVCSSEAIKTLENNLSNVKIEALPAVFIEEGERLTKFKPEAICRWLISKEISYLCIFDNKELLIFNQFEIDNTEDLLYYTLNVFEQLKLTADQVQVEISGKSKSFELDAKLANEYLPSLSRQFDIQGLKADLINDSSITENFTLLNMFLCG